MVDVNVVISALVAVKVIMGMVAISGVFEVISPEFEVMEGSD